MFWRSKKLDQKLRPEEGLSYGKILMRRFRGDRMTRWALRLFYGLVFVGLFSDFMANEKPLYCKIEGRTHFPVIEDYLVSLGLKDPMKTLGRPQWKRLDYERVLWAPIPYSAYRPDRSNMGYVGPFEEQKVESARFRHWLGTDRIGRDLLAGLIAGTRIALAVGLIAMGIASLIGIILGLLAGYFGDDQIKISRRRLLLLALGLLVGWYWGFFSTSFGLAEGKTIAYLLKGLVILAASLIVSYTLARLAEQVAPKEKLVKIPLDLLIMRLVEVVDAMPAILLILAGTSVIKAPSIYNVMIIIGLVSWTTITRFVRAEVMRVREQDFIQATKAMGFSDLRILLRHVLPNSLGPVLIVIAFGIAGAILAEATISFLGIGLDEEDITWGYLLNQARGRSAAWWMAIFPGLAIFMAVTIFNLLGEGLTKALNPKLGGG
jgi:peptide/nickel transport system permease protein